MNGMGVIEEFVQQIDGNTVKDTVDLLDTAYSNTSAVEQVIVYILYDVLHDTEILCSRLDL